VHPTSACVENLKEGSARARMSGVATGSDSFVGSSISGKKERFVLNIWGRRLRCRSQEGFQLLKSLAPGKGGGGSL